MDIATLVKVRKLKTFRDMILVNLLLGLIVTPTTFLLYSHDAISVDTAIIGIGGLYILSWWFLWGAGFIIQTSIDTLTDEARTTTP